MHMRSFLSSAEDSAQSIDLKGGTHNWEYILELCNLAKAKLQSLDGNTAMAEPSFAYQDFWHTALLEVLRSGRAGNHQQREADGRSWECWAEAQS